MKKLLFLFLVLQFGFLFAQNTKTETSEKSLLEKYSKYISPQYEDVTKRDLRTKQYKIGEDHYLAILHANPVAYYDQLGQLQDISNNIVTSTQFISAGYIYRNEANDLLYYFTQDGSRCLITDQQGTQLLKVIFTEELTGGSVILDNNKIIVTGKGFEYEWIVEGTSLRIIVPKSNVYDPALNTQPYTFEWLQKQTLINQNHFNTSEIIKCSLITHSIKNYEANISEIFYTRNELSKNIKERESNLYTELNFNSLSLIGASLYGYIKKTSSGSFSKAISSMRIQNESSTGCGYGYRSFAKFELYSIPSGSKITKTEQHMSVIALNESWNDYLEYDVHRVSDDPSNASNSTLWSSISDGTLYENNELCSSVGHDEWSDIPAETDVQNAISSGWFALGYMVDCSENNSDFYAKFSSPYMVIDYTPPPKKVVSVAWVNENNSNITISSASYGVKVWVRLEATGYPNEKISGITYEDDLTSNRPVKNVEWTMPSSGNYAWTSWTIDDFEWEGGLDPNPEYFVRVIKDGVTKDSPNLDVSDATAPPIVMLISPPDNFETGITPIIFYWNAVTDGQSGIDYYDIQFDSDNPINVGNKTSKEHEVKKGKNTWKVRAIDKAGNRGIWSDPRSISDVKLVDIKSPKEYSLTQNYPNPFNPSTTINFGLVEESNVSLKINDITGQVVKTVLDQETLPAGTYKYNFIADQLPTGIYLYVINAKSTVSNKTFRGVKKMILLK